MSIKPWVLPSVLHKAGIVACAWDPCTWAVAGDSQVQGHPQLYKELETSLGSETCLKEKTVEGKGHWPLNMGSLTLSRLQGLEVPLIAVVQWSTPKLPFTQSIYTHYR